MHVVPRDEAAAAAVRRLREIVAAVADLDPDGVALDADLYDDLLVDSLQKLEIVVRLEREFGVRLTDHEAAGLRTLRAAVAVLRARGKLGDG